MENFERQLAQATSPETRDVLGAIAFVINRSATTLYHHAAGFQSLDPNAPPLDPDSTVAIMSAGKFLTHIAALQLVERGTLALDEPVSAVLPELDRLPIITHDPSSTSSFQLVPATKKITLRHLLLHTSGLSSTDDPAIARYLATDPAPLYPPDAKSFIVRNLSKPLVAEPGEGFAYGSSTHWAQLLVARLAAKEADGSKDGANFLGYMRTNVFEPLGLEASTYVPAETPPVWERRLRMVERKEGVLVEADGQTQGLTCSISDIKKILRDLLSSESKLLRDRNLVDLLFSDGQLTGPALDKLRGDPENWKYCTGSPVTTSGDGPPSVNWTAAGVMVMGSGSQERWGIPDGTITWEGSPNVRWAVNREKGLALFFATQLIPFGDEKAHGLAELFMKDAWKTFA
ncbi:beta-lactamase family protein [Echria macrotheca]|uniref:Beta-lactamase family protein n=1 Tax=Echria macrotheca TaxID=438768 RepID=A0AAJ0BMY6_9PEZI|nr:beta-lactamase family protein [Echria macrotheca]